ncbi:MAG: polyprenyl synthetase family protein [Paenibacillaceae bacterium]
MKLLDIYTSLKGDIRYIEDELDKSIRSDHALLNKTSLHLLKAGGKRIRPVFVLLAGQFGDYSLERLKQVAVTLELIHMASLVHDDVIDDADTRRGQFTVKSKWDNRIAMYTGDYIFAKALMVLTELADPQIHKILSKAIVQMTIGEMEQIRYFFHYEQTVREYLLRIRRKTALLFAVSCQLGALAVGADSSKSRALYAFGYNVGMAFQIRDDILDICGTEKQIGKPPGSDIRQGNITLPFIMALKDSPRRETMIAHIETIREADGKADTSTLLQLLRESNGLEQAEKLLELYIEKAIVAVSQLPEQSAKRSLIEIAHFVGNRTY